MKTRYIALLSLSCGHDAVRRRGGVTARSKNNGRCAHALEEQYDIVPLAQGAALTPKSPPRGDVRLIEVVRHDRDQRHGRNRPRAARPRVGADADAILRLSYLDPRPGVRSSPPAGADCPERVRRRRP